MLVSTEALAAWHDKRNREGVEAFLGSLSIYLTREQKEDHLRECLLKSEFECPGCGLRNHQHPDDCYALFIFLKKPPSRNMRAYVMRGPMTI